MAGTITWRLQLGGADQARADFKSLGDAGAQAAQTTGAGWTAAGQQADAATNRVNTLANAWQQAAAERRAYDSDLKTSGAVRPSTEMEQQQAALAAAAQAAQSRINATIGVGSARSGSAAASASVFAEQLTAMERLETRANSLRAALSPLAAAQQKYGSAVKEAGVLVSAGVISETEHAAAVGAARVALEDAEKAALKAGSGLHLTSVQAMELEHSARAMMDAIIAGRNPVQALTMELGRLGQVMGEGSGGISGSMAALGRIILGPIGAVGAFAAALLAAGAAEQTFAAGEAEIERALIGAGRASGATAAQIQAMAEEGAKAGNVSIGAAKSMEVQFLRTGTIGTAVFPGLIAVQRDFAAAMGLTSKAATEELTKAFADPARGAEELNKSLHFLSDAQMQQISDLQEAGERTQAQTLMLGALKDATQGAADHLNILGQALHSVSVFFSDAWQNAGKFIYSLTHLPDVTKLADLDKQIAEHQAMLSAGGLGRGATVVSTQLADLQRQRAALAADQTRGDNEASGRAGAVAREYNPEIAEVRRMQDQLTDLQHQAAKGFPGVKPEERAEDERLLQALPRAIATALSPQEREVREAAIRAELQSRPGSARRGQLQEEQARLQVAGQVLTPAQADAIIASGKLQGENRGARVDNAAAKRAEAEANRQSTAEKESSDTVLKAQEAGEKADETIATAKVSRAKDALEAAASDASLSVQARQSAIAQAASDLAIQNAKGDRLKLELARIEQDRLRQLNDVAHQKDWDDAQRARAAAAINAASKQQAGAAREQDAARQGNADAAAGAAGDKYQAAALKSQAGDLGLPVEARAKAEQTLLDLQQGEAQARLETIVSAQGVKAATAQRDRQELAASQAAELKLQTDTQVRQLAMAGMEAAKGLATTQAARNGIEREQLKISQEQRDAATKILVAQLDEAVAHNLLTQATRDQLVARLTTATMNLNASEQEVQRRQQLTPLGKLYDPSQQRSPRDMAESDAAEASAKLSSAFVSLEENTTTFGKALRDVVTSIQSTVLTQLTNRALAPIDRMIDQGIDKLFPAAADTGTTSANAAMAQSAGAASAAISNLATAASEAATRLGMPGAGGGGFGSFFGSIGSASTGSIDSLQASGNWADVDAFAGGGLISGRGTGTSDSNVARVSHGEYIVNARATAQHYDLIDHINAGGSLPGFAAGGYFGDDTRERRHRAFAASNPSASASGMGGAGGDVHLHNHTGQPMKASASKSANGDMLVTLSPWFDKAAKGRAADPNGLSRDLRNLPQTRKTRVR